MLRASMVCSDYTLKDACKKKLVTFFPYSILAVTLVNEGGFFLLLLSSNRRKYRVPVCKYDEYNYFGSHRILSLLVELQRRILKVDADGAS